MWHNHFRDFTIDCIQTCDTVKQHPFAPTADEVGRGYRWFLWMWSVWQSLNLLTHSHHCDGPKIISDTFSEWIRSLNDSPSLYPYCSSPFLPMFLRRCITVRPRKSSADGRNPATPAKMVHSGRLQFRSWLRLRSPACDVYWTIRGNMKKAEGNAYFLCCIITRLKFVWSILLILPFKI